ncbi:hypothetical protein RKD37_001756 [Streptomyces ambofaciens]
MTEMPAQTVVMLIQGPPEEADQAIVVLQEHGISSQASERGRGVVEAWFDSPSWPPTPEFECECLSRVTEAVAETRFIAIDLGRQETSPLSSYVAVHRETGEALGFLIDTHQDAALTAVALHEWMQRVGIAAKDIRWQAVDGLDPSELQQ